MITVFHLSDRATDTERMDAMLGFDAAKHASKCAELWMGGRYNVVAAVQSDSLDYAWQHTNHIDHAWNDVAYAIPAQVVPASTTGQRSSSVGDIMALGDELYVVSSFGFTKLDFVSGKHEEVV